MTDLLTPVRTAWDKNITASPVSLTRADLIATVRETEGVDVGEIIWEYDGYKCFGFTVVGNATAAFGRFLLAVMRSYQDGEVMHELVSRVIVDSRKIVKVVYFPNIPIED